jgi:adenosylcobinamide-GDP ribazoletransferase
MEHVEMGAIDGLKTLVAMFTVIPVRKSHFSEETSEYLPLTIIIGALYGVFAGTIYSGLALILPTFASAAIMLLTIYLLNGFFHVDGLIDFGDGIAAFGDKQKKLSAMKDVRVGAGGLILALLTTIATVSLYSVLPYVQLFLFVFAIEVLCKNSLLACATLGKPHESGIGKQFVEAMNKKRLLASTLLTLAFLILIMFSYNYFLHLIITCEVKIFLLLSPVLSIISGASIAVLSNRIFGCVTGDVLGASHEISRLILLALIVAVISLYA